MAHFRTEIKGNRGWVSRTGTKNSGMVAHIHGWHSGIKVEAVHDPDTEQDVYYVYSTKGADRMDDGYLITVLEEDEIE